MKKLIAKMVLCGDWTKVLIGVVIISIGLLLPGCGTVRGFGSLVGGIGSDLENASDGYNQEYHLKHNR